MAGEQISVLYQSSDFYAPFTGVSIVSFLEHHKHHKKITVYLLDNKISEENHQKLDEIVKNYNRDLVWIDTNQINIFLQSVGVPQWNGSYAAYSKLFVLELLPDTVERILYIDSDTIVADKVDELFLMNIDDFLCAMTLDAMYDKHKMYIGLSSSTGYFNTGVMLFQVKNWREEHCQNKILDHIKNIRSNYAVADQDIVNCLFRDKIYKLPSKYNFNTGFFTYGINMMCQIVGLNCDNYYSEDEIQQAQHDAAIYHCFGGVGRRPWEKGSSNPITKLWDRYLELTPWYGMEKIVAKETYQLKIQRFLFKYAPRNFYIKLHRSMLGRYYRKKDLIEPTIKYKK